VLFWIGVGLAPVSALLLLVGSGTGSLRAAVGLLIISVIMVGISIMLRRDSEGIKSEIEETVYEEIDHVRADVRDDIGHAVQATHRALGEKMQYLMDQVESTRAELEATKAQLESLRQQPAVAQHRGAAAPAAGQGGQRQAMPPGIVRHTETVQVTTRHTVMDPHEDAQRGTTYGTRQPITARGGAPSHRDRDDYWERPTTKPPAAPRWGLVTVGRASATTTTAASCAWASDGPGSTPTAAEQKCALRTAGLRYAAKPASTAHAGKRTSVSTPPATSPTETTAADAAPSRAQTAKTAGPTTATIAMIVIVIATETATADRAWPLRAPLPLADPRYLSMSPTTKNIEPRMAIRSGTRQPGRSVESAWTLA
jgi:hypothetical protein